MAAFQGYNPYGGYGMPTQMTQQMYQQPAQQMYMNPQQMQMMAQSQQVQQPSVTVRLVTNYNEADAAQIAFDNTINLFVNMASGEIYVKRFDPSSGRAPIVIYRQEQPKSVQEARGQQPEYATVEMVTAIENRLNELSDAFTAKRNKGVKTDE